MKFENEKLGCSFTVPDRPTVRQQLAFWEPTRRGMSEAEANWEGAKTLILDWDCPAMPDYKIGLDEVSNPTITLLIMWVVSKVVVYLGSLEDLPKN